jgi:class 3 adenylate cyclase/tetratricopeptide (TPR) repeat protein
VSQGGRTATVLFSDLVGSTEMSARLGEAFEEIRRSHFAALREVVNRTGGREVKTLGDGVLAVFESAADAVRCGVAMQQTVDRHSRASPTPLVIRVGLALGDVNFEDGDVFGPPVIEAARLVQAARGGQILATAMVRWATANRSGATFYDVGELELKGLPEPVPTCEVSWEPVASSLLPLPPMLTEIGRIFVGRDEQLERLGQIWKEAAATGVRLGLLAGEPGVGKTRLSVELAGKVWGEGATVLAGRCDEDLGVPYQPFVEALRWFVDHAPVGELEAGLGRHGGELVRLVPVLSERLPGLPAPLRSDPETEQYRLFDAVSDWLRCLCSGTPLLLVLDDLQWAAKPTLLLLRHVVRSATSVPLLVLGTYRDTELGHDHPLVELLADLRRQRNVERISLAGLDSAGVAAFMERAAGHDIDDEGLALAHAIHEETEGNPFFVREVLRHLAETGAIYVADGRWTSRAPVEELGIPEGVREVVGRRLSRLSEDATRALRLAAVVGTEFDARVLRAAADMGEDALISALEEAIGARLVNEVPGGKQGDTPRPPGPRYRFAHVLVRETLYDELSAARRVAFHRRVAEAVEAVHRGRLDDHLPALAFHWSRASAPAAEVDRAVDYATRAGDRALAQLAHHEAMTFYRQALELLDGAELPPDTARRLELLISLGDAQRRAGDVAYRQTLLDAAHLAEERHDASAMSRAALANSRGHIYSAATEVDSERVAVLEAALAATGEDQPALRARLLANLGLELAWVPERERPLRLSDEALAFARRVGDPATLAHVLLTRDYAIAAPDNVAERLANTGELLELAEVLGDPVINSRAWALRFRSAMEVSDVDEAVRCLEANEALVAELGQPSLAWPVMMQRAGLQLLRGEIDAAEAGYLAAYQHGVATGQPDASNYLWAQQLALSFERGRTGQLEDMVRLLSGLVADPIRLFGQQLSGGDDVEEVVHRLAQRAVVVKVWLATLQVETGQFDDARRIFEELAADGFAAPFDFIWLRLASAMASVCTELGDGARAPVLHDLLEPYAGRLVHIAQASVVTGSVSYYLGLLDGLMGRYDEAESRFSAAAVQHERIGAPTWLARTRLEWARMLLSRRQPGDAERARELLGQVLTVSRDLGLAGVEQRAASLLT